MLLRPLTVAAGVLALPATQAFLLPPEVSDADIQIAHDLAIVGPQIAEVQVVDVECPGCPILVKGKHGHDIQVPADQKSHLELTFSIDHQPAFDRLLLNGFEMYPADNPLRALSEVLSAPQILDREERRHKKHRGKHHGEPQPQRLGYGMQMSGRKDAAGEFTLVTIDLQILQLGTTAIDGIPNVSVKLVKDRDGRLAITQIEKTPSTSKALDEAAEGGPEQCKTLMCALIALGKQTEAKLGKFKPFKHCLGGFFAKGGMRPHHHHGHPHPHPHHHRPPHAHHGGHWREGYRHHSWGQLFKNIGSHILLPVLIGIAAGVSISL